ncbi:dsDNA nuclease domain-containing protein [Elizabethkingia miricola]|uniref:dsDNA nuclease domain-containing protein n=1 Tax=Elizabethkingia miricola TaxID=172045 RepID=UPI0011788FDD|nr:dsDNA nuclease domain-containing protein [Elizabethkingia miricola]WQM40051.1 dsDNA nuclease domain-containing protein [Elizabethkingia miricola]
MSLLEKFKSIRPRENSGSMASNRFDFQKNWAICKLIELMANNSDFLLAFEFHEDIIVLDSSTSPNQIDFFQIKTKDNGRSYNLKELLKRKKLKNGDGDSILGKLYQNKLNFETETNSLNIVSNTVFKLNSNFQNEILICCQDLSIDEKTQIENYLKSELGIEWFEEFLNVIFFHTTELTIQHHNEITKDKLNKFIESIYNIDVKYNPSLAYRTIFDEVNRRNNIEKDINSFEELIKLKSISKSDFENMLKIVISEPDKLEQLKKTIFNSLDLAGISISLRKNLINSWKDVEIQYLSVTNDFFMKCVDIIKKSINKNLNGLDTGILQCLDIIYKDISDHKVILSQKIYSEYFLKIIILKELYDEE